MDDKIYAHKTYNNILIESKNIINTPKNFDLSKRKNKYKNKLYAISNGDSQNEKNIIYYYATENNNNSLEFKENINYNDGFERKINNDSSNKVKTFIRLKKGLHIKKKAKSSRNNNNDKNRLFTSNINENEENNYFEDISPKEKSRKSEILNHSYSLDNYLNLSSNLNFKYKSYLENSHLFSYNFVKNMKNQKRKNDLIKAFQKYKNFKSLIPKYSEEKLRLCNLKETHYDSEKENVGKRLEQINRIKIQNIINFKNLYESIHIRKSYDKYREGKNKRKIEYDQLKSPKKTFERKLLKEEKYIIEEDGKKKKILEINRSFLPDKVDIETKEGSKFIDIEENQFQIQKNKEMLKNSNKKIIISNQNVIKSKRENNNLLLLKRRSYKNINSHEKSFINDKKNKIFIKKHPCKQMINNKLRLNNKLIINKEIVKRNQLSEYNILDNNIMNHNYLEIKNLSIAENNNKSPTNLKYNKKILKIDFDKDIFKKPNLSNSNGDLKNENNSYLNNSIYKQINLKKYKKLFHPNRSYDSKDHQNNNLLYEVKNKDSQNSKNSKQFNMFNLNNQNNLEQNKNNNFIIINTSSNYK